MCSSNTNSMWPSVPMIRSAAPPWPQAILIRPTPPPSLQPTVAGDVNAFAVADAGTDRVDLPAVVGLGQVHGVHGHIHHRTAARVGDALAPPGLVGLGPRPRAVRRGH